MKQRLAHVLGSFFIILAFATTVSLYMPKTPAKGEDIRVIPDEAIRLRILANSNSEADQQIKRLVGTG